MASLAIRNWDTYNLDDYFSEKEFVTLVKRVNNSSFTLPNTLNESATTPTIQPDPYDLLLDTAMKELAQELEELQLIRDKRKELAQSQKSKNQRQALIRQSRIKLMDSSQTREDENPNSHNDETQDSVPDSDLSKLNPSMIMGFTQLVPPYIPTDDEEEEEDEPLSTREGFRSID